LQTLTFDSAALAETVCCFAAGVNPFGIGETGFVGVTNCFAVDIA